jgi:multicomponent K+:H+ antiporter subunit E/multicomponent Na+:H+ antiporter subunit E
MMRRAGIAVALAATFLWQVVNSGVVTAWLILRPGQRPQPALVRMPFAGLNETGAALLGCMITLTPGTTAIDIDMERGEMLVHLLDGSDPEASLASVHADFERPLCALCPAEPRP